MSGCASNESEDAERKKERDPREGYKPFIKCAPCQKGYRVNPLSIGWITLLSVHSQTQHLHSRVSQLTIGYLARGSLFSSLPNVFTIDCLVRCTKGP